MKPRFWTWLIILAALVLTGGGIGYFLFAQGSTTAGRAVWVLALLAVDVWAGLGLWWWRDRAWVNKLGRLIVFWLVCGLLLALLLALGFTTAAIIVGGVWAMTTAFFVGLELLRLLLSPGYATLGIARTLLDEAIRMRLGLVFVVMVVVMVAILPFTTGGETRLQYRLESFLTYALTVVSTLLAVMTILLAVRTVSSELQERQAFLTLTKPVGRLRYLAGKWLGIMALNLLLLTVAGVGVVAFVRVLERQPAMDPLDRAAVQEQVLTARHVARPVPVDANGLARAVETRIDELQVRDPGTFGPPGTPLDDATLENIRLQVYRDWLTLGFRDTTTYRFTGLSDAKAVAPTVQLRLKPKAAGALDDERVQLSFRVNDRPYIDPRTGGDVPRIRDDTFHTFYLTTDLIRDDGTIDIAITSGGNDAPPQPTLSFNPKDGMELFYRVGGFVPNVARGLAILWVRLGFLAMLGLAAATFLGFPVACLLSFLVYLTAVGSGYLAESLTSYASLQTQQADWWSAIGIVFEKFRSEIAEGEYWDAFKVLVRLVGEAFTLVVPSFEDYNPTPQVAYGRAVPWSSVGGAVLKVGLFWTGVVALIAGYIFHRRELARVTV